MILAREDQPLTESYLNELRVNTTKNWVLRTKNVGRSCAVGRGVMVFDGVWVVVVVVCGGDDGGPKMSSFARNLVRNRSWRSDNNEKNPLTISIVNHWQGRSDARLSQVTFAVVDE